LNKIDSSKSLLFLSSDNKTVLRKVFFFFFSVTFLAICSFTADYDIQKVDTNAKIKAVFIYNFTKYIEWPSDYQKGEFTIGILGDNDALYDELDKMSKVKKVANQSFSIQKYKSISEVKNPHILYIPNDSSTDLSQAVSKLKTKSTLIVTEAPGLARKGSSINFIVEGNRQKFELNKSTTESHNLKVASALENLAVLVN
tara:strand:- start:957 stop:1553 length:597 start_codon:yes stop_codon:yes gene_type:complete